VQIEYQNNRRGSGAGGIVARILAAVVSIALLVVGFMFSLVIFAVALAVGVIVFGWMWWKFRKAIRLARQDPRFQQFNEQMRRGAPPPGRGDIIEGEVIRDEPQDKDHR
jgi:Flp pilus assembly protein TadB